MGVRRGREERVGMMAGMGIVVVVGGVEEGALVVEEGLEVVEVLGEGSEEGAGTVDDGRTVLFSRTYGHAGSTAFGVMSCFLSN